jgi:hypothetical protein
VIITKEWLREKDACEDGYKWAVPVLKKGMPLSRFVKKFSRADWLVWTLDKAGLLTHQQNVLLACMYARSVLHLFPDGEERPRLAIEAAEAWAKNPSDTAWAAASAASAASAAAHKSLVKDTLELLDAWGVFRSSKKSRATEAKP